VPMDKTYLDHTSRKLIGLLQTDFPLSREPYAELGIQLGINHDEVIQRIRQLRKRKIVRQISPIFDARKLGHQPTLVAMRVTGGDLERMEQLIVAHPGVSHAYERDHSFNLWFTLSAHPGTHLDWELEQLTSSIRVEARITLPAVKIYKIGACFTMGNGHETAVTTAQNGSALPEKARLSKADRSIINELQQDLPPTQTPFSAMAARLCMTEDHFLTGCRSLKKRGIMRRYGAAINHRNAGYKANAMTCWVAPADKIDAAARKLASLSEVSHCYERKTNPLWHYNLFAMIHGRTREVCREIVNTVSAETGLSDYVILFSTREVKKTRVQYQV
jgi:DNA-binding Lrp family transcriptional regulator